MEQGVRFMLDVGAVALANKVSQYAAFGKISTSP